MSKDNYSSSIGGEQGLEIFGGDAKSKRKPRPQRPTGTFTEPPREIPIYAETDVLVIGGGPAGTAASIAASRLGAEVMLVERYNHLGGLSTGGLVIWIDRMTDWTGTQIIAAASTCFARIAEAKLPILILHGAADPVSDPERSRGLAGGTVEVRVLDGLLHHPLQETRADEVFGAIVEWLRDRIPG